MQIKIDGDPVAWERMGVNFKARRIYDRQDKVRSFFKAVIRSGVKEPFPAGEPLHIECVFFVRRNAIDRGSVYPTSVAYGDLDNMVKFLLDCCNVTAFKDDAQVVSISAKKVFADTNGVRPCTKLILN